MRKFLFTAIGIGFCIPMSFGQRNCGTMDYHAQNIANDPQSIKRHEKFNSTVEQWIRANGDQHRAGNLITIPTVVHVVYRNATQNISQAQIQSQIDVLNADYRKMNSDTGLVPAAWKSIAADVEVEFCLAQRDPNGLPTTGITRTSTTDNGFGLDDQVKYNAQGGKDAWPRDQYLNIWVCNMSGGLLGYAQFPGQPAATDGVVIGYNYFGNTGTVSAPFNEGRTTTHEVGHWLGLYHIWGDDNGTCTGSDNVNDTPNQASETYNCPSGVQTDNCSPSAPGYMWMNYMDYTNDACMYFFTNGQKTRMRAALGGIRASLANSQGCVPVQLAANDAGITAVVQPNGTSCGDEVTPVVTLFNYGSNALTSCTIHWQIDGGTTFTYAWTGNLASQASVNVTLNATAVGQGAHTLTAYTSSPNSQTDGNTTNDQSQGTFTTTSAASAQPIPFTYNFAATTWAPTGWTIENPDNQFTWERSSTVGLNGAGAAWINNYDYNASNEIDDLVMPPLNLAGASTASLTFDVSYCLYSQSGFSDTLAVLGSSDCGVTWTVLYRKGGQPLTTVTPYYQSTAFTPNSASQWRNESVNLTPFLGQNSVILKFRNTTQYENNLYIDNINISGVVGLNAGVLERHVSIQPNPSNGLFRLHVGMEEAQDLDITISNPQGKLIHSQRSQGFGPRTLDLDLSTLPAGVYFVQVRQGDLKVSKRIVKI